MKKQLVLVHGWGFTNTVWDSVLPPLGEVFELTAVNLPGYGSRPQTAQMTLAEFAEDVASQLPESAIWVGWSLGGQVALQAALQLPQLVEKLILVGATPKFVQGGGWRAAVKQKILNDFGTELIRSRETTLGRFIALQMLGVSGGREVINRLKGSLKQPPQSGTLEAGLDILNHTDFLQQLADVVQPALWLMGERDQLVPATAGEQAAAMMPDGCYQMVQGAGHAPFLSHPQQFLDEVIRFAGG